MPDTGAPWNIPYVESTDLVSDWPADSLALANAIDSGLDAAGGLVAVKHALFTGTQTNSTAGGANFAITDLSITHEVADASNKLIISAFIGTAGSSAGNGRVGLAIFDGTNFVNLPVGAGARSELAAGGQVSATTDTAVATMPSISFVHTPGAGSKTYTVEAINISGATQTIYINRSEVDANNIGGLSTLTWDESNTAKKPTKKALDDAAPQVERDLQWKAIRADRDRRLAASDWTQVSDAPVDAAAWATYRQQLRDLPQNYILPSDVEWPEEP